MFNEALAKDDLQTAILDVAAKGASSEHLFDLVFDLFLSTSEEGSTRKKAQCEDVLTKLIAYVEIEARCRISQRIAVLEEAPKRVVQCLALEVIDVARPVLSQSPVLDDDDLLMVARLCGEDHLEAIATRSELTLAVSNELMRLGGAQVWETLAQNKGAELAERSLAFLINRARENTKIQLSLIERHDMPDSALTRVMKEASDSLRDHLRKRGRHDLLQRVDQARSEATTRVRSSVGSIGVEYDVAYEHIVNIEKTGKLSPNDLLEAAANNNFPMVTAVFARLTDMGIEDAVHWLSRRQLEPALVALKAIHIERNVVMALLNTGPWRRVLNQTMRQKALKAFDELDGDVARRIFSKRTSNLSSEAGTA